MGKPIRFLFVLFPVLALAILVVTIPRITRGAAQMDRPDTMQDIELPEIEEFTPQEQALQDALDALGEGFDGEVGLAVRDNTTGHVFHYNGDGLFPQQSVSKLWVALAALDLVDKEQFSLSEAVVLRGQDTTVFHEPLGDLVRARGYVVTDFRDLFERALTRSDNLANDRMLRRVGGPDVVQAWLDNNGLGAIRFGTDERTKQSEIAGLEWQQHLSYGGNFFDARDRVPAPQRRAAFEKYLADPVDGASPVLMAVALGRLAKGRLLSADSTELMLSTLEETRSGPRRLKGGLPPGWTIAHKTGTGQYYEGEQSGYNDVGILTAPDGHQYAVVAMIRRTGAPNGARMEVMQELVRSVGRFHEAAYATPQPGQSEVVS